MRTTGIILLTSTLLAACGGGDDDSGATPDAGPAAADGAAQLAVSFVSPPEGVVGGGTSVTLVGSRFVDPTHVLIDGVEASPVTVIADGVLVFMTPPVADAREVDITVYNEHGFVTVEDGYLYHQATRLDSVTPAFGPVAGGNTVTLKGAGFLDFNAGTTVVTIGGNAVGAVNVVDDETITFAAPAGEAFTQVAVAVSNNYGSPPARTYGYADTVLIGADGRGGRIGNLYLINPFTAETMVARTLGHGYTGLAFSPDGTLYGAESNGSCCGGSRQLYRIDPFGTEEEPLGFLGQQVAGMTFHGDRLFGWSESNDDPVSIDTATGQATPIGGGTGSSGSGMASNGTTIYFAPGSASAGDQLWVLDPDTGAVMGDLVLAGTASGNISAMAFLGDRLFGVREGTGLFPTRFDLGAVPGGGGDSGSTLIEIDLETGLVTDIGPLPPNIDSLEGISTATIE